MQVTGSLLTKICLGWAVSAPNFLLYDITINIMVIIKKSPISTHTEQQASLHNKSQTSQIINLQQNNAC